MKLISWNVNGIRAVDRKGELDLLIKRENPEILMMQETKAHPDQLSEHLVNNSKYLQFYHRAEKKGYSGTSIWVDRKFEEKCIFSSVMPVFKDIEGRISRLDLENSTYLNIYFFDRPYISIYKRPKIESTMLL